jgi:glycosyltransferase involved in cell wall biosynthesis
MRMGMGEVHGTSIKYFVGQFWSSKCYKWGENIMKILMMNATFVPRKFGGATMFSYNLAKSLVRRGHEVTVYTTDVNDRYSRLSDVYGVKDVEGIKTHYFRNLNNFLAAEYRLFLPIGMISATKRKAIKKDIVNVDVINFNDFRIFQTIIVHQYAKKYGIPYVVDAHGSTPRMIGGKRGFKWLLRWLVDIAFGNRILKGACRCIAETEVGVNEYKELGVKQDKIVLVTPPFSIEDFSHLPPHGIFRHKYNIKENNIILFLGRMHWIKGLDFLVKSFYELTKDRDNVILVIVGPDDGYKSTLDELIDKLNLSDKVLFTGILSGDDKLSALVDADVVVQTSRYEQGAWAPFEAILCNTPIIVSSNSGAGEDVRKIDAGYLVEWGNKKELKDAMQNILDDPTEALNKTQKAKEYIIKNLSMQKNVEKYEKVYIDCIKEKIQR